jgi:cytochrome c peroxidase
MRTPLLVFQSVVLAGLIAGSAFADELTPVEALGKQLFFDNISDPPWVSCATCHSPATGWTGPIAGMNLHGSVYRGAVPIRFGNRKPPSVAYATLSPIFHFDVTGLAVGGNFWDGRATGEVLGNPAADQALDPFLNPVEQNNPSKQAVCLQVSNSKYADLFEEVWGPDSLDCSAAGVDETYDLIALSLEAYQASSEVNQFSSKFDRFLEGEVELTEEEALGFELFRGKAFCSLCHTTHEDPPLFTGFAYANIGTPRNPDNPFYDMDTVLLDDGTPINPLGRDWVDSGLGGFLATRPEFAHLADVNRGKHKTPTVRNVAKGFGGGFPKAYTHNGYFKSLKSLVHFYNTRDVKDPCPDPFTVEKEALAQDCWPEPEVTANMTRGIVGNLGLTPEEEDALVAFMETLSDGFRVPQHRSQAAPRRNP